MKSEWQHKKLGEIGQVVSGATPTTRKAENYQGGLIPWITPKDLSNHHGRYISHGERNITESGLKSSAAKMMPANSILFSSRAPIGYIAIASNPVCTNQGFKSIVPNEDIFPLFLYYLLVHNREKIKALGSGTTFMEVSASTMSGVEVDIPSLATQRKIAAILSALDDKIENNNAICKNLEEQLKCLFDLRFRNMIDSSGMSQYTPLASLCERITKGTTPTTLGLPFVDEGINFIKAESITDKHIFDWHRFAKIGPDTHTALNRSQLSENDIVFSIAGTLGRFALVDKTILPANTNQAVAIIRADKNKVEPEYLYSFFLAGWHHEYCQKRVQQAVQANLSLTTIKSMPIIMLDEPARREYVAQISPIMQMISQRQLENRSLAILRDALLPKMMSGEINVDTICAH